MLERSIYCGEGVGGGGGVGGEKNVLGSILSSFHNEDSFFTLIQMNFRCLKFFGTLVFPLLPERNLTFFVYLT